ncbi:YdgH/BhsA/McbA-like domain containing protein [Sodalis sp. dw_96]|uniref:YdgH/BhsA/McbA-like domain containing protein n=1 Tax=Sodalis sp. dw_96 TaxID=2719794 RepID=UPI001BD3175C|nr:YdgH/BhsA/McbA-like domain containing protein [Sodalis sp. dw_96]
MKNLTLFAMTLSAIVTSVNALAAQEITAQEAVDKGYKKIATVHTTAKATSPMDAKAILSQRADEKGGNYYVIIAGREHGRFSATAEVYE